MRMTPRDLTGRSAQPVEQIERNRSERQIRQMASHVCHQHHGAG
jgi:hypothetical protein